MGAEAAAVCLSQRGGYCAAASTVSSDDNGKSSAANGEGEQRRGRRRFPGVQRRLRRSFTVGGPLSTAVAPGSQWWRLRLTTAANTRSRVSQSKQNHEEGRRRRKVCSQRASRRWLSHDRMPPRVPIGYAETRPVSALASPKTFSPALHRTLGMAAHPVQYIRLHVRYGARSNGHAGESI